MSKCAPAALSLALGCLASLAAASTTRADEAPAAATQAAPRLELVTVEAGDDVFSRFGHTAVRVIRGDDDFAVSFGAAPFNRPSFLLSFLRGEAQFRVSAMTWKDMLAFYTPQNRTMVRQPLQLSPTQARALNEAMLAYFQPGKSHYTYDQLRDNCATRIRDLLDDATGGALRAATEGATGNVYRDYTARAMAGAPLRSFALDFAGGPNQDQPVSGWGELYLPEALRRAVADARVDGHALAPETLPVMARRGPASTEGPLRVGRYGYLAFAVLVASVTLLARRREKLQRAAGVLLIAFGAWTAVWALALDALVAVSRVADFAWNENVLAWLPSDAVLCVVGARALRGRMNAPLSPWMTRYLQARPPWAAALVVATLAGVLPQDNVVFTLGPALVFGVLWPKSPPVPLAVSP